MYQSLIRLNTPPFIPSIWLCYVHSPPYLMDRERKCLVWSAWEEVGARVILQYNCCLVGLYCALQQCTVVCTVQYSGARWREHSHNLQVSGHWHQRWSLALPRQWSPYYHTSHYKSQITCADIDSNLTNSYTHFKVYIPTLKEYSMFDSSLCQFCSGSSGFWRNLNGLFDYGQMRRGFAGTCVADKKLEQHL